MSEQTYCFTVCSMRIYFVINAVEFKFVEQMAPLKQKQELWRELKFDMFF